MERRAEEDEKRVRGTRPKAWIQTVLVFTRAGSRVPALGRTAPWNGERRIPCGGGASASEREAAAGRRPARVSA
jgi:hypothetical protein